MRFFNTGCPQHPIRNLKTFALRNNFWIGVDHSQFTQIAVTLPSGVNPGDVIHVKAPDGRLNAITVPGGMGPGSTFTVEFADDTPSPAKEEDLAPGVFVPTVFAKPEVETGVLASSWGTSGGGDVVANASEGPYVPAVYATPETNSKI